MHKKRQTNEPKNAYLQSPKNDVINQIQSIDAATVFDNKISNDSNKLLTIDDLSGWLNISKKSIYNMIYRSEIEYIKLGRLVRFDKKVIEKWLSSCKKEANQCR